MLAVFGALNVMCADQVVDPERAVVFFGSTLYLALFAIWLPGYMTSAGARGCSCAPTSPRRSHRP